MGKEDPISKYNITFDEWSTAVDHVDLRTPIASLTNKIGRDAVDAAIVEMVLQNRANPPRKRTKKGSPAERPAQTELPTHLSSQFEAVSQEPSFDDFDAMMRDTGAPSKFQNRRYTRGGGVG